MFAESLLLLYASAHRTLCADISVQILYDICNSTLCAINYLRRSLRMTSLCLACAVGRPHSHYSKGSSSFCSIDYSLLSNHSPSEWFSLYKYRRGGTQPPSRFYYGTFSRRRRGLSRPQPFRSRITYSPHSITNCLRSFNLLSSGEERDRGGLPGGTIRKRWGLLLEPGAQSGCHCLFGAHAGGRI